MIDLSEWEYSLREVRLLAFFMNDLPDADTADDKT